MDSAVFPRTVLDSVTEAISVIDVRDFSIISANRAFLTQCGLTEAQAVGRKCYELTHRRDTPCAAPQDVCPLDEMIARGERTVVEHIHYDEKGGRMYVEVMAYPILNDAGRVIQAVHLSRDITERKNFIDQLNNRIRELKGVNSLFQKYLSLGSETEAAFLSMTTSISQLSFEVDSLLTQARLEAKLSALVPGLERLAGETSRLSRQAATTVSRISLPPAERLRVDPQ